MTRPSSRHASISTIVLSTLVLNILLSALPVGFTEQRIGLGVSGQLEFIAEQGTRELQGHVYVINEGTAASNYGVASEGQIASLEGWNVTASPTSFQLTPSATRKVSVVIKCPDVQGTYSGGLRVSASAENVTGAGVGVPEIVVEITVRLTPMGTVTTYGAEGTVTRISKPHLFNSTNPAVIDARNTTGAVLLMSTIPGPCTVSVSNVTPPSSILPQPGTFSLLGSIVEINSNVSTGIDATLRLYYDPQKVARKGLDESSLKAYSWDGKQWVAIEPSQVNTGEHYVSARITHLSYFAAMIQLPSPFYTQWWFYLGLASVPIAATVWILTRRGSQTRIRVMPHSLDTQCGRGLWSPLSQSQGTGTIPS